MNILKYSVVTFLMIVLSGLTGAVAAPVEVNWSLTLNTHTASAVSNWFIDHTLDNRLIAIYGETNVKVEGLNQFVITAPEEVFTKNPLVVYPEYAAKWLDVYTNDGPVSSSDPSFEGSGYLNIGIGSVYLQYFVIPMVANNAASVLSGSAVSNINLVQTSATPLPGAGILFMIGAMSAYFIRKKQNVIKC